MATRAPKVLLVEDNSDIRTAIAVYLRANGFEVSEAADGESGLSLFSRVTPDVLLLDWLLPRKDGLAVLRAVRSLPQGGEVPAIMMSAVFRPRDMVAASAGLDVAEFMTKPFQLQRLVETLRRLTGAPEPARRPARTSQVKTGAKGSTEGGHRAGRLEVRRRPLPRHGSLAQFPVAEILHSLYVESATAILGLSESLVSKRVYVLNGYPVYVESDVRSETLGAYLLRLGRLTTEQHQLVIELMRQTGRRQGELLLEKGFLTPHELYDALRDHMAEKIISCLAWEAGEYRVESGVEFGARVVTFKMEPARLILDGIERHYTAARVSGLLPLRDDARPFLREGAPYREEQLSLNTLEARMFDMARRAVSVGQIVARSGSERLSVQRVLYALYAMEVLGFDTTGEGRAARPRPTPSPTAASKPTAAPAQSDRSQELVADYLRLKDADYFTLLGLAKGAPTEEVHAAFRTRARRYHPDSVGDLPPAVRDQAEELYLKLVEAYQTLADPKRRARYLEESTPQPSAAQPTGALESEHLFREAKAAVDADRPKLAVDKLRQALKLKPGEPAYESWLGWAQYLIDPAANHKKAEKHLEMARRAHPDQPEPYLFMARISEFLGQNDRAGELYRKAAVRAPNDVEITREVHLFELRLSKGRTRSASSGGGSGAAFNADLGTLLRKLLRKD